MPDDPAVPGRADVLTPVVRADAALTSKRAPKIERVGVGYMRREISR